MLDRIMKHDGVPPLAKNRLLDPPEQWFPRMGSET